VANFSKYCGAICEIVGNSMALSPRLGRHRIWHNVWRLLLHFCSTANFSPVKWISGSRLCRTLQGLMPLFPVTKITTSKVLMDLLANYRSQFIKNSQISENNVLWAKPVNNQK